MLIIFTFLESAKLIARMIPSLCAKRFRTEISTSLKRFQLIFVMSTKQNVFEHNSYRF